MSALIPARGVIAVIRSNDSEIAYTLGKGFSQTSVTAIEVTMTTPNAIGVMERLIGEGVERVGAGTVRTLQQVKEIARIGARFVVCPHLDERIVKAAVDAGLAVTPGAVTPTEIVQAINWGATSTKIFPINSVGGLSYVKFIIEPLPDVSLVVSGGVQPEEVQSYLDAGCVGVCMGGALWTEEIAATGDVARVENYARKALAKM